MLRPERSPEPTDTYCFHRGYITISALDGDWTMDNVTLLLSLQDRLAGWEALSKIRRP